VKLKHKIHTHTQIFGIKALWDIKVLLLHIRACQEVFPILSEKKVTECAPSNALEEAILLLLASLVQFVSKIENEA